MKMTPTSFAVYLIAASSVCVAATLIISKPATPDHEPAPVNNKHGRIESPAKALEVGRNERLALISAGAFVEFIAYLLHLKEAMAQLVVVMTMLIKFHSMATILDALLRCEPNQIILIIVWAAFVLFPPAGLIALMIEMMVRKRMGSRP